MCECWSDCCSFIQAVFDKNTQYLTTNSKEKVSLMNICMQLRKCCNHPFLLKGVEGNIAAEAKDKTELITKLIAMSGKFVLLEKVCSRAVAAAACLSLCLP